MKISAVMHFWMVKQSFFCHGKERLDVEKTVCYLKITQLLLFFMDIHENKGLIFSISLSFFLSSLSFPIFLLGDQYPVSVFKV